MLHIQLWLVLQQRCRELVWELGQEDEAEVSMEAFSSECDPKWEAGTLDSRSVSEDG